MRKIIIFSLSVFVFCFGFILSGCAQDTAKTAPEISAGAWFNADGPVKLADLKDKLVVVEFWATWCPPCRASIPHLAEMFKKYKDKGVVFISLSNEPKGVIANFVKKAGMKWIIGAESRTGGAYGVTGIPHAFIIKDGKIVWEGHPMAGLEQQIEKLVAERKNAQPVKANVKENCKDDSCSGSCSGSCGDCAGCGGN